MSTKPPFGSNLDYEHPLTEHLLLSFPFNEGGGAITSSHKLRKSYPIEGTYSWVDGIKFENGKIEIDQNDIFAENPDYRRLPEYTLEIEISNYKPSNYSYRQYILYMQGTLQLVLYYLGSRGFLIYYLQYDNGAYVRSFIPHDKCHIVVTTRNNYLILYINGEVYDYFYLGCHHSGMLLGRSPFIVGCRGHFQYPYNGVLNYFNFYNKSFTNKDVLHRKYNPYEFYESLVPSVCYTLPIDVQVENTQDTKIVSNYTISEYSDSNLNINNFKFVNQDTSNSVSNLFFLNQNSKLSVSNFRKKLLDTFLECNTLIKSLSDLKLILNSFKRLDFDTKLTLNNFINIYQDIKLSLSNFKSYIQDLKLIINLVYNLVNDLKIVLNTEKVTNQDSRLNIITDVKVIYDLKLFINNLLLISSDTNIKLENLISNITETKFNLSNQVKKYFDTKLSVNQQIIEVNQFTDTKLTIISEIYHVFDTYLELLNQSQQQAVYLSRLIERYSNLVNVFHFDYVLGQWYMPFYNYNIFIKED